REGTAPSTRAQLGRFGGPDRFGDGAGRRCRVPPDGGVQRRHLRREFPGVVDAARVVPHQLVPKALHLLNAQTWKARLIALRAADTAAVAVEDVAQQRDQTLFRAEQARVSPDYQQCPQRKTSEQGIVYLRGASVR